MTTENLLAELRRRDVGLRLHGTGLRCTAPVGMLTAELRDEIRLRKSEILEILAAAETVRTAPRAIVPLQPHGDLTPVFGVPCDDGDVSCYSHFARDLGGGRPFFGLEPPGLDGTMAPLTRIEDLAAYFEEQIVAFRPAGPLIVAGYRTGGTAAFELGRRLAQSGMKVPFVALFGSPHPSWYHGPAQVSFRMREQLGRASKHARSLWSAPGGSLRYVADSMLRFRSRREAAYEAAVDPVVTRRRFLEQVTVAAVRQYRIRPYHGRLALFLPNRKWLLSSVPLWCAAAGKARVYHGPGDSLEHTMLGQHSADFAALFRLACEEHEGASPRPV
jgi:thioesterase domain-containing protein